MAMAAPHLTPVTLELGGKSPVIVAADADLAVAARRIAWGKFFNAGQTCVSPDYLVVESSAKDELVKGIIESVLTFFGENPASSASFARIVNAKRFAILKGYLGQGRIVWGGAYDESDRYIEPTIMEDIAHDSPMMSEEIFGPILPIVEFDTLDELVEIVRRHRYPLSLYLFTGSERTKRFVFDRIEFGGGALNNTVVQLANPNLPFGGVGNSGMGRYHGRYSFETFSHRKSVLESSVWPDFNARYAPYSDSKLNFVKRLMGIKK
jgi:aldehyde dehydrogenase (NAD+)